MSTPELQPEVPLDQQVTEIPDAPEIPTHIEQAGVSSVPAQVQPVQDDSGQTVVQPVPAPPTPASPSITVPVADQGSLEQLAKRKPSDSARWFGVSWLRKIKIAVAKGATVLFGK